MPNRDLTELQARKAARVARKQVSKLFDELEIRRGPGRTEGIYKLLSEVRRISDKWRKETTLSKLYLRKQLNILAGRDFKVDRPPEFMLLRAAISNRQVYSAWAKVATIARSRKVPPKSTSQWIEEQGGIDTIIRDTISTEK